MRERFVILLLIVAVVALPIALRQGHGGSAVPEPGADVLVLISPHTEAVRDEFTRAFRAYWRQQTGRDAYLDWRAVGGTSDITRYLNAQYANAFRNEWTGPLHQTWSSAVEQGFADARLTPGAPPPANLTAAQRADYDQALAARTAFLASNVSVGVDIFFGGGSFDFAQQAGRGQLVPSGVEQRHPDWFTPAIIPLEYAGETLRDAQGRWQGAVLSSFGIIFNRDRVAAAGFPGEPATWADLADPRFAHAVGLADPSQSGSNAKAYEMLIQQQMQLAVAALPPIPAGGNVTAAQAPALAAGWLAGMRLSQLAAANSAYFTDNANKPVLDTAAGDCAIGMAIDFYGRMEEETLAQRNPADPARADRFAYLMPHGGSSLSADPIALLRGAPHPDIARAFIDFVLSPAGQKIWDFRPGTPGGPERQALRRSPIRRDLYDAQYRPYLSDPDVRPYEETGSFVYHAAWTSPVFNEMRFAIKVAFIDPHPELADAWAAIRRAQREGRTTAANAALAKLQDLVAIDYDAVHGPIKQALNAGPLARLDLESQLNDHFRRQYAAARALADGG